MSAPTSALHGMADRLLQALVHTPTAGQLKAIDAFERLLATDRERATLILRGYAGTGKTTLVGALVKVLRKHVPLVLLAPTGRAAKVLGAHAQLTASTIHRRIYRVACEEEGWSGAEVAMNKDKGVLFIVDEASMIGSGASSFGDRDLLHDLLEHIFSAEGCKLLLIGDPAQLPPVGSDHSPALDVKDLRALGLTAGIIELTEVVRQAEASGILRNATELRALLTGPGDGEPSLRATAKESEAITSSPADKLLPHFTPFPDVIRFTGLDLQDALETAYGRHGADEVCVICRSNKGAYQYNRQVRVRIYGYEEELCPGDRLMVVKNNYLWAGRNGRPELIANGEPMTVKRVHRIEEHYGLRFADLTTTWWNGTEERELDVKVILDTLASEGPALPGQRMKLLVQQVLASIIAPTKGARYKLLREDPFANALQVKYAYAVTAHKAQGGQWHTVFVDQGYVTEEMLDREYVRWLYTAITRATDQLHLLNFHPRFWGEE